MFGSNKCFKQTSKKQNQYTEIRTSNEFSKKSHSQQPAARQKEEGEERKEGRRKGGGTEGKGEGWGN